MIEAAGNYKITLIRNIGSNRGKRRIWIEGKALARFGWTKGTSYVQANFSYAPPYRNWIDLVKGNKQSDVGGSFLLKKKSKVTEKRIAGTIDRPIIDLCGNYVAKLFKGYKTVQIHITTNSIEIEGNE